MTQETTQDLINWQNLSSSEIAELPLADLIEAPYHELSPEAQRAVVNALSEEAKSPTVRAAKLRKTSQRLSGKTVATKVDLNSLFE